VKWLKWLRWLQQYRLLAVIFALGSFVGGREYMVSRAQPTGGPGGCEASAASCFAIRSSALATRDPAFWSRHARMVEVVAGLNPDDPDTGFLHGMEALAAGDEAEFVQQFEKAIAAGVKHNHLLLQYYAQYLLDRGADWRLVNEAVNRWRENHPFSPETISLNLSAGPRSSSDASALRQALAGVRWIADARLERYSENGMERWRLRLSFRPGRTVDMREAVAAMTVLSIPEEQRPLYEVTCQTLQDCRATRLIER
jgi:hypothetical protein